MQYRKARFKIINFIYFDLTIMWYVFWMSKVFLSSPECLFCISYLPARFDCSESEFLLRWWPDFLRRRTKWWPDDEETTTTTTTAATGRWWSDEATITKWQRDDHQATIWLSPNDGTITEWRQDDHQATIRLSPNDDEHQTTERLSPNDDRMMTKCWLVTVFQV